MVQVEVQPVQVIDFAGDEFAPEHVSLPFLQVLNHQMAERTGLFISVENSISVGFRPTDEWSRFEAQFQSGTVDGFRSTVGRFLIVRKGPLLMFSRANQEYLGVYDRGVYDRGLHVLKTRYLVYLVSKQKQLLHDMPLQFTVKGSFCGDFGQSQNNFRGQMNMAFGQPRNDRFHALCIFAVKLKPVQKGQDQRSWVCSIDCYGIPTKDNWRNYFVGGTAIQDKILAEYQAYEGFGTMANNNSLDILG